MKSTPVEEPKKRKNVEARNISPYINSTNSTSSSRMKTGVVENKKKGV